MILRHSKVLEDWENVSNRTFVNWSDKILGKRRGLTTSVHQILVSALIFFECVFIEELSEKT